MVDDPDSDKWNDHIMHGEKLTINHYKLLLRETGVVFVLKGDIFSMITEYDFNKTDSPDAKQNINFLDEMHFDIHAECKSSRDENHIKSIIIKELY